MSNLQCHLPQKDILISCISLMKIWAMVNEEIFFKPTTILFWSPFFNSNNRHCATFTINLSWHYRYIWINFNVNTTRKELETYIKLMLVQTCKKKNDSYALHVIYKTSNWSKHSRKRRTWICSNAYMQWTIHIQKWHWLKTGSIHPLNEACNP